MAAEAFLPAVAGLMPLVPVHAPLGNTNAGQKIGRADALRPAFLR